jgi:hypothetical protein
MTSHSFEFFYGFYFAADADYIYVMIGYFYALSLSSGQFDDSLINLGIKLLHASGLLGCCSLSRYSPNHNSVVYNVVRLGNYLQTKKHHFQYIFIPLLIEVQ